MVSIYAIIKLHLSVRLEMPEKQVRQVLAETIPEHLSSMCSTYNTSIVLMCVRIQRSC